jgi:hypothetical protein
MAGGDDRYYHSSGQSAAGNSGNVRCAAGQLGQSREFHYNVQEHHGSGSGGSAYRTSSSTSSGTARSSGSRSDAGSGYHHSPHVSTTSRSRSGRDYYLESKASPYHHATGSSRSSGIRSGTSSAERQDQNYAILRQRHQQAAAAAAAAANAAAVAAAAAEYEHRLTHHSGSRSDLLEHDHNAVMYEHGLSSASPYGVPPQTQYTFVRMCDGKFVRTAIPLHDFDSLEGSGYYRVAASSVNHTLRRPTKRHSSAAATALAAAAAVAAGGGDSYACCPRVDDLSRSSRAAPATYATLRGQKWAHRQKSGCGVGDNYGRSGGLSYHDESRSVTDDFLALPRAPSDLHHLPPPSNVSLAMATSKMGGVKGGLAGAVMLSRSTDRNLDNLGLDDDDDDDDDLDDEEEDDDDLFPVRTSDEALSLLTREPPDGKEKPEPSKTSLHKMETLSRKSSKCDLLPTSGNNSSSVGNNNNMEAASCRSEAASICGDTSSVLSGSTMVGMDRSKADGKRDSLSSGVTNKDNNGSNLFADGILPPPPLTLPMPQDELDVSGHNAASGGSDFR